MLFRIVAAAAAFLAAFAPYPGRAFEAPIYPVEAFFETTQFRLGSPGGTWSPDGKSLLISSDETGIFNVYRVDVATGRREALTQSRDQSKYAIGFLYDGESFLYAADGGGDELTHIYLQLPDGEVYDLTPGASVKAEFLGFTDRRRHFFVATNERDANTFDVYRYRSRDLTRERVFVNEMKLGSLTVSPDGRYVAGILEKGAADDDVYVVRVDGRGGEAEPQLLTPHDGDVEHAVFAFTPRGGRLVIGSNAGSEFIEAWEVPVGRGDRRPLVQANWDVSSVAFSPSGRYQVHATNEDGTTRTSFLDRGRPVRLPPAMPDGSITQVRFAPGEDRVAAIVSSSRSPGNIVVFPIDGSGDAPRRLTDALGSRIDPGHLVSAEVVRYRSFDGLPIPSILWKPLGATDFAPVPAIVLVHGGPGGQSRTGYNPMVQHLVNNGYAVLAVNNRGSSGYGKTFFHMDDRRHGEVDLKDVVAARGYLEGLDWVQGDRIAIMGGSYGGFMVMAALAFEPEAFDAGINIFGVTNWERTLKSIPPWWGAIRERLYDEMGDPATDVERHRRISPLFHADQVTKPVLIVQGANDPRVLQVESDDMVEALRRNDVPVEYVLFPDEGHGFQKRANRIAASAAYVRFLDRHLQGDVVPAGGQ